MLAIDLDGTLLDSHGRVSQKNAAAVRAARDAGVRVAVCTGRGLVECAHYLEAIGQRDPVVVAGGSIIACPVQRKTMHRFALEQALVEKATRRLLSHGHPVMILKDPVHAGYDYLMVVGSSRPLEDAWRIGQAGMVGWLSDLYGLDKLDAYQLLTQVSECPLANVVDVNYSSVTKVRKSLLPAADAYDGMHRRLRELAGTAG